MNKLAEAYYYANLAMAANYFLRTKSAEYNRKLSGIDFDSISDMALAANGVGISKSASFQQSGLTDEEAMYSALYDAAKGVIRMRNISQL